MKYILSIDGGGVRGVIPAMVLARLEQQTGKPSREIFSFVAGTSTGALIAAAIAAGIPAEVIVDVYKNRTGEIFGGWGPLNTAKRIATGSMYSTASLKRVISETLGAASNWKLNDSPIDLLLTAKHEQTTHPWYFVKDNPQNAKTTGNLNIVDCATASAAAPTYFPPYQIDGIGPMVDGGVGVTGNPVYQACVEAFEYGGYVPSETGVISLGTGRPKTVNPPASNLLSWLSWVLGVILNAPEEQQTELVRRHFDPLTAKPLDRIDCTLPGAVDMADAGAVPGLMVYGAQLAEDTDWNKILCG